MCNKINLRSNPVIKAVAEPTPPLRITRVASVGLTPIQNMRLLISSTQHLNQFEAC